MTYVLSQMVAIWGSLQTESHSKSTLLDNFLFYKIESWTRLTVVLATPVHCVKHICILGSNLIYTSDTVNFFFFFFTVLCYVLG